MSGVETLLLGIGNNARADDGVGVFISERLKAPGWLGINCGPVPENYTSVVRSSGARKAVLVDAVQMGLEPGSIRLIPKEKIGDFGLATHQIPLSRFIGYLETVGIPCVMIGLQPKDLVFREGLSPELKAAAQRLVGMLRDGSWERIPAVGAVEA